MGEGAAITRRRRVARPWPVLAIAVSLGSGVSARAQAVLFDFDTGTPALTVGRSVPFDQTSHGVTAHFSSPQGAIFSVQNDTTTGYRMSQFSANYLWPNALGTKHLDVQLSQPVGSISLTFATADFQQREIPTTIELTAYLGSASTPAVGSAQAHGTYGSDTMPMGTISFTSSAPFDLVRIGIPTQPLGTSVFLVDNVAVVPVVVASTPRAIRGVLHRIP